MSKCLDKMSRAKLSLSLYKANLSLLRHSSSCILCGISNSFIQIHIANSCTCFSCASLLRTMRYSAAGAQLHCAPDRTLGYAILFSLPFSPKHIGALRVHELRLFIFLVLDAKFFCLMGHRSAHAGGIIFAYTQHREPTRVTARAPLSTRWGYFIYRPPGTRWGYFIYRPPGTRWGYFIFSI